MFNSDDFSGASLDTSLWNLEGPTGISAGIATNATDSFLELVTPDGNFDAWGTNNSARAMQDIADGDFTLEARFLSVPTERFQLQGFIVEADASNWLRFDTYSDGSSLKAFAAVTSNGSSSARMNVTIPNGEAPYLKVTRAGDLWTFEYSQDGSNWTTAGSFTQAITVSSAGVFGGNVQQAAGFTAQVDYIELGSDPIVSEDAGFSPQNQAPEATDDAFGVVTDTPLDLVIATDLLGNDSDPDGDAISLASFTAASNGTVTDAGNGTLTYTPNQGYQGSDSFSYTITDGEDTDTAVVNLTVSGGGSQSGFNSDDFSGASLDTSLWNLEGPTGISAGIATNATDSFLELVTPDGNFDAWGTNNSARAMQDIADGDFTLEARFLSVPTERFQLQGFIVEADASNWLRFDTYSDGSSLKAFAAVTSNGSSSARMNVTIPNGEAPYLKVTRAGDLWTFEYSQDGSNWTTAGSFTQALTVSSAGVFGGNVQQAAGFTAQVDYIELGSDPIVSEDAGFSPQNQAPEATDDAFGVVTDTPLDLVIATDLLGNDSDPDGDAISLASFTAASNGTVTDAGNGTLTYTPNQGYQGSDSFSYTITDGEDTDTAVVNLTVSGGGSQSGFNSDDFSGASLDTSLWNLEGPTGISAGIATNATDSFLELVTPDGNFDAWGTNNSARAMQDIADGDFTLEARFLSVPTERFQLQGFIVEADASNWLRFDTYSDGSSLKAFAAVTSNGSSSARMNVTIPNGEAPYLKVTRAGDLWTFEYSQDGSNWTTAGSFTQAITVSSAGVFGGNVQQAAGFTAQVDYIELGSDPIVSEDAGFSPQNQAPEATDDAFGVVTDTPLDLVIATDLLGNDSDPDGDAISLASFTAASNGTVTDAGNGTLTYTPNQGYQGSDSFSYTITDGEDTDTAVVNLTVSGGGSQSGFNSDDFSGASLDTSLWNLEGPTGISAGIATNATDSFLELVTPDGNFDAWGTNNSARAMQDIADGDFTLEARFLSVPTERFQLQGFIVEADASNWLRFDTYSDGSSLKAFAAVTSNGSSSARMNVTIPNGEAPYLKVTRAGDLWTFEYSQDGSNWTTAGSFTQAITVSSAGVFGGNVQQAAGFTAQVDYIELGSDPIVSEDAGFSPQNQAPEATDDAFGVVTDTPLDLVIATDLLGNDSDPDGDAISLASFTAASNGTVTDAGNGTLTYTPNQGYQGSDSFSYTITDGEDTDTAVVNLTVSGGGSQSGFNSDDFSGASLDTSLWNLEGPTGISAGIATNATDSFLELVTPDGNFDAWGTNNSARAMQDIADGDFTLEARFLSVPTERFQLQGFIVEADASNWLRFDTYSDGSSLKAFAAVTSNGSSSARMNVTIPNGEAPYLKVTRAGDLWTFEYSQDGSNWTTAGSFTQALTVSSAGVFGGNVQQAAGFTAQVDYIELGSDPIVSEDAGFSPQNQAPEATDDAFGVVTDTPLDLVIATDLLGNDSDPDGDAISLASFTAASNGTVTDTGNGTLTYTPNQGYQGSDSFSYTITDGEDTDTAVVNLVITPPSTGDFESDDFVSGVLNTNIWRIEGPSGVSAAAAPTAADAVLELVTPDGNFDAWSGGNKSARAMQDIQNNDFLLETRFVSVPSERFQIQGILIEQDENNWMRFDTVSDGANLRAFAAIATNGSPAAQISVIIPGGVAEYLRVDRSGDIWTYDYSLDGTTWVNAGSFTHATTVTAAGVFAGNVQQAEGFTAKVDYVEIDRDPIANEDDGFVPVNIAPIANDDNFETLTNQPITLTVASDLLVNDTDENEDPISLSSLGAPISGTLVDNNDGTLTYTPDLDFQGTDSFEYTITDGELFGTGAVNVFTGDKIQVWYGDTQKFGNVGEAQTYINVLGNVYAEDLVSLSYTLNGGAVRSLTVGPDNARLENEGDFNVDIAFSELDGSATDDLITITANYGDGSVETEDVVIEYEDDEDWPSDYSIDWSTVSDIQDVAQVVDGKWELTGDGIRPVETGYDRFVIMGDTSWDFYEARTSVTVHDISAQFGLVGFALWWNGHTNDPHPGRQPLTGFNPSDLLFYQGAWVGTPHFDVYPNIGGGRFTMDEGVRYNLVIRAEQFNQIDRLYSLKIWEDGETEPVDWLMVQEIEHDVPISGAFGFVAHLYDVEYHDLQVTEIQGSDVLQGTDGADILVAADATSQGIGELDVFVGENGADLFVFGEAGVDFYDDGTAGAGEADYGYIWDFVSGTDQIQLGGSQADYVLTQDHSGLPEGTAIWRLGDSGEQDELIGVVHEVYGLALSSTDFIYDDVGL